MKRFQWISYFLAFASGCTTFWGLLITSDQADPIFVRWFIYPILATATVLFPVVVWPMMFETYPQEKRKARGPLKALLIVAVAIILGISTFLSVMGVGGKYAVQRHLDSTVEEAEETLTQLYDVRQKENSRLKPTLLSFAENFRKKAENESKTGDISGVRGRGPVTKQLFAISESYDGIVRRITESETEIANIFQEASKTIGTLRSIANNPTNDMNQKAGMFASALNQFNALLTDLNNTSVLSSTAAINENLEALTVVADVTGQGGVADKQRLARAKLDASVKQLKGIIQKELGALKEQSVEIKHFHMMPITYAIFRYFFFILPFWCVALGIDLAPLFLLISLSVIYGKYWREVQAGSTGA